MKNLFLKISSWMKDEHVIVIFKLWKMNIWYPNSWNSSKVMASNRGTVDNGLEEGPSPSSHKSEKIKKKIFSRLLFIENREVHLKTRSYLEKVTHCIDPTGQPQANVNSSLNCLLIFFSAKLLQYWQTGKQRQAHYQVVSDFSFLHKRQIFFKLNLLNVAEQQNYIHNLYRLFRFLVGL